MRWAPYVSVGKRREAAAEKNAAIKKERSCYSTD